MGVKKTIKVRNKCCRGVKKSNEGPQQVLLRHQKAQTIAVQKLFWHRKAQMIAAQKLFWG